ncbi:MAG: hypothetical protein FWF38_00015 [Spirochaetaceae bacterium]|nr:hypothetical protein [Spirochaetaceae bacterium]
MRKHAIPFFLIITALTILAVFAYNFFEIYETTVYKKASRQARTNEFLAMEQWLNKTGHPVRVISYANSSILLSAPEKNAIIFASLFRWQQDTYSKLQQWAEDGGHLIICLDIEEIDAEKQGITGFLSELGVMANYNGSETWENNSRSSNDDFPTLDSSVSFTILRPLANYAEKKTESISDASGKIKLVRIFINKGSITLCGDPVFMKSRNLDKEKNALLGWHLTGKQDIEKKGMLFVRGVKTEPGFFGKLAERGNFSLLLISALVLIAIGFWMVIPVFGSLAEDSDAERARPGKPMQERFLAEARFLKKYKGLGSYLEIYYISLKQRFRQQYGEIIDDESSFFSRLAEICDLNKEDVTEALAPLARKGRLTNQEFIKHIYTIETIMERL